MVRKRKARSKPSTANGKTHDWIAKYEAHPTLFAWDGGALLYVDQEVRLSTGAVYRSISAGLAPQTAELPAPSPFAAGP